MKILIISLAFAPYSGVGSARMTSFAKSLVQYGESVDVLCYDNSYMPDMQNRPIPEGVNRILVNYRSNKTQNRKEIKNKIKQVLSSSKYDIVVASVGPFDVMQYLPMLKLKYGTEYVIDYRDPWLFTGHRRALSLAGTVKSFVYDLLYTPIEYIACLFAKRLVFVSDRSKDDLVKKYGFRNKSRVIYNGYEKSDIKGLCHSDDVFRIGVFGKFSTYDKKRAIDFLNACETLKDKVEVIHVGEQEELSQLGYKVYKFLGHKSYDEAQKIMSSMDAFVVSFRSTSGLGTKVFDYIYHNKPVIYLGESYTELSSFVKQFEFGYSCDSYEEIESTVNKVCLKGKGQILSNQELLDYSREKQNQYYYDMLEECV